MKAKQIILFPFVLLLATLTYVVAKIYYLIKLIILSIIAIISIAIYKIKTALKGVKRNELS